MTQHGYTPYCGSNKPRFIPVGCSNPRTIFNGSQFGCPECGWTSEFPADFIDRYKEKWNLNETE